MPNNNPWILTFSGLTFSPLEPLSYQIIIEDIAHSLSLQCRYNGHCNRFYSVAEHSLIVSSALLKGTNDKSLAKYGLMHDASEAYLGDIVRPLKYSGLMEGYLQAEKKIQAMIYMEFLLDPVEPEIVNEYDNACLDAEIKGLTKFKGLGPFSIIKVHPSFEVTLTPVEAERNFLRKFNELFI